MSGKRGRGPKAVENVLRAGREIALPTLSRPRGFAPPDRLIRITEWGVGERPRERERLFRGLEALANHPDGKGYGTLSQQWGTFWPFELHDGTGEPVRWDPGCAKLFGVYLRDLGSLWNGMLELQGVRPWARSSAIQQAEAKLPAGVRKLRRVGQAVVGSLLGEFCNFLLGFGDQLKQASERCSGVPGLNEAWKSAKKVHPGLRPYNIKASLGMGMPGGGPRACLINDFQRALFLAVREPWRFRRCAHCGRRFLARYGAEQACKRQCATEENRRKTRERMRARRLAEAR